MTTSTKKAASSGAAFLFAIFSLCLELALGVRGHRLLAVLVLVELAAEDFQHDAVRRGD